jgi:predicted transcriptional regulator
MNAIRANDCRRPSIGVYGTRARKQAKEWGLKVDFWFNAFDNSILSACEGRDFILCVDEQMVPFVESKLNKLNRDFDLKIARNRA